MFGIRKPIYPRMVDAKHVNNQFPYLMSEALPREVGWYVINEMGLHDPSEFSTEPSTEDDPLLFVLHTTQSRIVRSEVYDSINTFLGLSPTKIDRIGFWDMEGYGTTKIFKIAPEKTRERQTLSKFALEKAVETIKSYSIHWRE